MLARAGDADRRRCAPYNSACDHQARCFCAHAYRSRRRHDRYLAAVSFARRRLHAERGDQPARARPDRTPPPRRRRIVLAGHESPRHGGALVRTRRLRRSAIAGAAGAALSSEQATLTTRVAGRCGISRPRHDRGGGALAAGRTLRRSERLLDLRTPPGDRALTVRTTVLSLRRHRRHRARRL